MDETKIVQEGEDDKEGSEPLKDGGTPQISLQAMHESVGFQIMRVMGHVGKCQIHILIDSVSTHNFLDEQFATKSGCSLVIRQLNPSL